MTRRHERNPDTAAFRAGDEVLTEQERAQIRAAVYALPPATEEEINGWCEVIINARVRAREHAENQTRDSA